MQVMMEDIVACSIASEIELQTVISIFELDKNANISLCTLNINLS